MRKRILEWLFGTSDIKRYVELLEDSIKLTEDFIKANKTHLETLEKYGEELDFSLKLIHICEEHEIDIDKELKQLKHKIKDGD